MFSTPNGKKILISDLAGEKEREDDIIDEDTLLELDDGLVLKFLDEKEAKQPRKPCKDCTRGLADAKEDRPNLLAAHVI